MKKTTRLFALLMAILLCLSLTGCKALDELREAQGFWQADGSISWDGNVYKLLETNNLDLNVTTDDEFSTIDVTKDDVPVLVASLFGQTFYVKNNKTLLVAYVNEGIYYCRADQYDKYAARIQSGYTQDKICYNYSKYTQDGSYEGDAVYTLTAQQMQQLMDIYNTATPTKLADGMYFSYDRSVQLYGSTEDDLLIKDLFFIQQAGNRYYIEDEENLYSVPESFNSLFAEIMADAVKAETHMGW